MFFDYLLFCCDVIFPQTFPGEVSRIHSQGLSLSLLFPPRSPVVFNFDFVIIFFNHCHLVVAAPIHSTLEGKVVLAEAFEYNVDGDFDDDDDDVNANGDCLCKF